MDRRQAIATMIGGIAAASLPAKPEPALRTVSLWLDSRSSVRWIPFPFEKLKRGHIFRFDDQPEKLLQAVGDAVRLNDSQALAPGNWGIMVQDLT